MMYIPYNLYEEKRESESPAPKEVKYFDEEWPQEEAILAIGLKQSRLTKAERQPSEKKESKPLNKAHSNEKGKRK